MNTNNIRHTVPKDAGMPTLTEALVVLCFSMGTMLLTVRAFQVFEPDVFELIGDSRFSMGLLIELLALGLPLALLFAVKRYSLSRSLGLVPCGFSSLAGGGLMGAGTVFFTPQLEAWLARCVSPPEGYFETMIDFFNLKSGESLAWALFCVGLMPAVVFHLVHNSLALILLNLMLPGNYGWIEGTADVPAPLLALGAFLLVSGAIILLQRAPGKEPARKSLNQPE